MQPMYFCPNCSQYHASCTPGHTQSRHFIKFKQLIDSQPRAHVQNYSVNSRNRKDGNRLVYAEGQARGGVQTTVKAIRRARYAESDSMTTEKSGARVKRAVLNETAFTDDPSHDMPFARPLELTAEEQSWMALDFEEQVIVGASHQQNRISLHYNMESRHRAHTKVQTAQKQSIDYAGAMAELRLMLTRNQNSKRMLSKKSSRDLKSQFSFGNLKPRPTKVGSNYRTAQHQPRTSRDGNETRCRYFDNRCLGYEFEEEGETEYKFQSIALI